jgi:hypothetical protein
LGGEEVCSQGVPSEGQGRVVQIDAVVCSVVLAIANEIDPLEGLSVGAGEREEFREGAAIDSGQHSVGQEGPKFPDGAGDGVNIVLQGLGAEWEVAALINLAAEIKKLSEEDFLPDLADEVSLGVVGELGEEVGQGG